MSSSISTGPGITRTTPPMPSNRFSSVARHALVGGAIGAAAGAALSLTALPIVGGLWAPVAAAIGGAAGIVVGGIAGLVRTRSSIQDGRVGAATIQAAPPAPRPEGVLPPPLPR